MIENFRPGVCERLGLSADALRAQKPSLIWCSISGFGQHGPYRDKPAYDIVVQALSGGMSLTGARDGVAVRAGIPIIEVVIAAVTERMWATLCEILGCEELTCDLRFLTADDRKRNRSALLPILDQRFRLRPADEWMTLCDQKGLPVGIVNTLDRVMADQQIAHRGMIIELTGGEGRRARVIGDPIFFKEAARPVPHYPPASGEDSTAVLKEVLGLGDAEIAAMIDNGMVRTKKPPKD